MDSSPRRVTGRAAGKVQRGLASLRQASERRRQRQMLLRKRALAERECAFFLFEVHGRWAEVRALRSVWGAVTGVLADTGMEAFCILTSGRTDVERFGERLDDVVAVYLMGTPRLVGAVLARAAEFAPLRCDRAVWWDGALLGKVRAAFGHGRLYVPEGGPLGARHMAAASYGGPIQVSPDLLAGADSLGMFTRGMDAGEKERVESMLAARWKALWAGLESLASR